MDEYFLRAEEFLKTMAEGAEHARTALAQDNWDGYEEAMSVKSNAFHHFLTTDHILESSHPDYLKDDRWLELWNDLQESEKALAAQIEIYQSSLNQTLRKIRKTKVAVGRYQSGQKEKSAFEDGV
ncbi:MAG: hypothetical protein EOP07_19085 [Proteobacteria bacterium]|nr:MAG: hypothetical protein EOP07_19085 [Pseudomonadota bacterium]